MKTGLWVAPAILSMSLFTTGQDWQHCQSAAREIESQTTQAMEPNPPTTPSASPAPSVLAPQSTQRQEQTQKPVYESATVLKAVTRLVVVDVVATDRQGRAVTDLQRKDFTVLEDGQKQQVRMFSLQQPNLSAEGGVKPTALKLPEGVFTNTPRYDTDNALNVVLLDALNTPTSDQAYAREEMIKYLRTMPENRPVAVYLLGNKLTLLQDFTTNPVVLQKVIRKLKSKPSPVLDSPTGGPDPEVLPPGVVDAKLIPEQMLQLLMEFEQERVASQTDLRVNYTLAALTAISHSLAGYPGRKNLIWVSAMFPLSIDPNRELTRDVFAGTRTYAPQIDAAADRLMDAQIAIYPIDARGLMTATVIDADTRGDDKYGRGHLDSPDASRISDALSDQSSALQSVHAAMEEMAERTGGQAYYNRNDIDEAVRRSMEDGSTYYTLAYYPENKDWKAKFRKIQIAIERPGIKLRYRRGYYALDPKSFSNESQKQQAQAFGQALDLGSPVATGLIFEARVVPPSDTTGNQVLIKFALDPHAISFESTSDGLRHATVACVVQAYSTKGKIVKTEASTVNATFQPETFKEVMARSFPCQRSIGLPEGSYLLRLGVRDDHTGLIGTANAQVTVARDSVQNPPAQDNRHERKP